jgi:predicted secreted protein
VRALSGTISGSGVLALEALSTWRGFLFGGVSKNCRVKIDVPLADSGGHFAGKFILTRFEVSGEIGDKINVTVELQNDGEVTWVAASA